MYEAYATRRQAYFSTLRRNSCNPSSTKFPDFQQRYQNPGEKIIASCIARNYFVKEKLYNNRMCQMSADRWLSCDHTFKVSANIGFWFNKRWVKLYDTLLRSASRPFGSKMLTPDWLIHLSLRANRSNANSILNRKN